MPLFRSELPWARTAGQRRPPSGRAHGRASRVAALLLPAALLLAACSGPTYVEQKVDYADLDYQARHERMLEVVLERPAILEAQRRYREEERRTRYKDNWAEVMARQENFVQVERQKRRRDPEAFERMLERQRTLNQGRDSERNDRWAQFIERNAPPAEP